MTAEQATRAFFEACGSSNWDEVGKFMPMPLNDKLKQMLGGINIVSIGESFTSAGSPSVFVPYEIKFGNGQNAKHNLALRKDNSTGRWFFDGGL
jgi:hypothetical protein